MPDQYPYRLRVEQPAQGETEAASLTQLAQLLADPDTLPADVRDLAPTVRQLFPNPPTSSAAAVLTSGCTAPPTPPAWPSSANC